MYFIYFIALSLSAVSDIFFLKNRAYKNLLYIFCIFWLIVLASTREHVGIDWKAYESMFYNQNELISQNIEIGYTYINNILKGLSFNVLLLLVASLSFLFISIFTYEFVFYKLIFLLVYFSDLFFYLNLSGMRQGIALALTLFSTFFIVRKKFVCFVITIIIACLFHKTAIFFILAYFVQYFKASFRNILLGAILSLAISTLFLGITDVASQLGYFRDIKLYTDQSYNDIYTLGDYIIGGIKRIMPLLLLLSVVRLKNLESNIFVKLYLVGLLCYFALYQSFPDVAVRLSLYFLVFDAVIYNYIFVYCKKNSMKMAYMLVVFILTAYKVYGYATLDGYDYQNIIW
ncbi:EpsG family protein [Escherichia coli]|nr:EpsG family protein [Escherichia coli]MCK2274818.1 EpsG family protein [Escherichia coli]